MDLLYMSHIVATKTNILDNIQAEPGSSSWKLKTVYDSCMNYGSSELPGAMHFQAFLKDQLGITNWPYLDSDFKFADSSLSKLLGHVWSLGEFPGISIYVPEEDSEINYTYSVNNYGSDFIEEVEVHALDYFDLSQEETEVILNDIEFVENSIKDLYSNLKNTTCSENCTHVYVNCLNLSDEEWIPLCENVKVFHDEIAKFKLKERRDVIVLEVGNDIFVKKFISFLVSLPHRSIANYFAFRFLWEYLEEINVHFRLTKLKLDENQIEEERYSGVQPDLFKHCMKWITTNMKDSLGREVFRHYLKPSVTDEISGFYNEFKSEMKKILHRQDWILPPEQKSRILDQVGNLTLNVLEMKNILENNTLLDDLYKSVHPTRENFFDNALQYKRANYFGANFVRRLFLDKQEEEILYTTLFDVDAAAGKDTGMTYLNYGILFPPHYLPNLRRDMNRLMLGNTLGHEIGHIVDFYLDPEEYELYQWPWLANHTVDVPPEIFLEEKQCIDNQFSEFKFDISKKNLNGSQYSRENIGDYIGTALIDKILGEYDSAPQNQFLLPGLDYSTKQFLYIASFQTFCSKSNLKSEEYYQELQQHAPGKFRIIGASQNSRSYPSLFQCPDGSFMNPKKKCSLLSAI